MNISTIIEYLKEKQWNSTDITYVVLYMIIASLLTTPIFGIPIGLACFLYLNDKENLKAFQRDYDRK
ncbi:hypothetical protein ERX27_02490 [Macrococcus brunensis]|uniref:VraH family protein n=1 Tax=Macrococcus brunensis TaxID=198483 RepID=A0A4R6BFX9_9STAP|nr:hypothetical protein [Macrococcus brunensis]TDL98663.1 hypothetical protein ERX27_02490 [Macrococcus brunensis]ULG73699.1 VraH family protein [Macrococcus brunensis]